MGWGAIGRRDLKSDRSGEMVGSAGIKDKGEVGCTGDKGTSGAREHRRGLSVRGTYGTGVTGPIGRRSKRTAECEIGVIIRVRRGCARLSESDCLQVTAY